MHRVLMIEDNDDDIELAQRAFERAGLSGHVRVARDGQAGLGYLFDASSGPPIKLVLLDLNLPKTSGLDVLRQIRANEMTRDLPVVVLTISRKEPDLLQSFTMGATDYLIKPLNGERFTQIYQKYVKEGPA